MIHNDRIFSWVDNYFYLLKYWSKRSGKNNDTTRLILDFKRGNNEAVEIAIKLASEAIEAFFLLHHEFARCFNRYIISIPSSSSERLNGPCERVCAALEYRFKWLEHIPNALKRTRTVNKSSVATSGNRTTFDEHVKSIKYQGPRLEQNGCAVIIFDDVITEKTTSNACCHILRESAICNEIFGIFLGRTQWKTNDAKEQLTLSL